MSAEVLDAGFWPRGEDSSGPRPVCRSVSGFGSGDELDVCEPGPALAGLTDAAAGEENLASLDDDELVGVIRAWRRLESWTAAGTLSAIAELARRRPADRTRPAPPGAFPAQISLNPSLALQTKKSARLYCHPLDEDRWGYSRRRTPFRYLHQYPSRPSRTIVGRSQKPTN